MKRCWSREPGIQAALSASLSIFYRNEKDLSLSLGSLPHPLIAHQLRFGFMLLKWGWALSKVGGKQQSCAGEAAFI